MCQVTRSQCWFIWKFGAKQATRHYLDKWWPTLLTQKCITKPRWATQNTSVPLVLRGRTLLSGIAKLALSICDTFCLALALNVCLYGLCLPLSNDKHFFSWLSASVGNYVSDKLVMKRQNYINNEIYNCKLDLQMIYRHVFSYFLRTKITSPESRISLDN